LEGSAQFARNIRLPYSSVMAVGLWFAQAVWLKAHLSANFVMEKRW